MQINYHWQAQQNPTFGWKKDKWDKHDLLRMAVAVLPEEVILSSQLTPVRNQGNCSSCVGFGVGINLNSEAKKLNIYTEWHSPTYLYNGARYIEGTLAQDIGCSPRDALQWLYDNGGLLEQYWPYSGFDQTAPSSVRISQATKYNQLKYFRCVDGVGGICTALADGHMVSIGSPWPTTWMSVDKSGMLPTITPTTSISGGHETCLYGYNLSKEELYGVNSWGTSWGKDGFYTMPFQAIETFKHLGGYDAHYITMEPTIPSPPDPAPPHQCWLSKLIGGTIKWNI